MDRTLEVLHGGGVVGPGTGSGEVVRDPVVVGGVIKERGEELELGGKEAGFFECAVF